MDHDVVSVLLDILVVLVAAKAAAEIAERIRIPAVVGEIVAGILIGPSALDLVGSGDVLRTLGELGVVLLLLEVGMEMDLGELGKVGRTSLLVATVGVVAPLVLGLGAMTAIGDDFDTALFVARALTATSVGITARVFGDLRALATTEARVVLGAAVADDVMGLMVLTVVVRVVTEGSVSTVDVVTILLGAIAFLVVGGVARALDRPPTVRPDRAPGAVGGNDRRPRARVHTGVRRARGRRAARGGRGRVPRRPRARADGAVGADPPRAGAGRAPLHPGVLPPDRDRCRRLELRAAHGAARRGDPARGRRGREAGGRDRHRRERRATSCSSGSGCSHAARSG